MVFELLFLRINTKKISLERFMINQIWKSFEFSLKNWTYTRTLLYCTDNIIPYGQYCTLQTILYGTDSTLPFVHYCTLQTVFFRTDSIVSEGQFFYRKHCIDPYGQKIVSYWQLFTVRAVLYCSVNIIPYWQWFYLLKVLNGTLFLENILLFSKLI